MLRCHTGWPRIDELKRTSMEALHLPSGWKIEKVRDQEQPAPDFMLVNPNGRKFAVVIESFEHVMLLTSSYAEPRLLWRNGMPILPNPIERMEELASRTRATPVLWLPRPRPGVFRVRTASWPVLVVRGRAWQLLGCLDSDSSTQASA